MWLHARRSNIYLGPVSQMFCDPRPELYELDVYPGVVWGKTAILAWDKNREDILASLAQLHQEGGAA